MAKLWEQFNCYSVLGITPPTSPEQLRAAYRAASLRSHPDRGGTNEAQARVNTAYEVLSDPVMRVAHDLLWLVRTVKQQTPRTSAQPPASTPAKASDHQRSEVEDPLSSLRNRVQHAVAEATRRIWQDVEVRAERAASAFRKGMSSARQVLAWSFAGVVVCTAIGVRVHVFWFGTVLSVLGFIGNLVGPKLNGRTHSAFRIGSKWVAREARAQAENECSREAETLRRYASSIASMVELLLRPSTFADSEAYVARRIATVFFLLGYRPRMYLAQDRTLIFMAGDEQVVVRFRHRTGAPVNAAYVQGLVTAKGRSRTAYLFCSPGLSGNAAKLAQEHGIHWYTLETMEQWIYDAVVADYAGPEGDILTQLDELSKFIDGLAASLPRSQVRTGSWRRRRRW